MSATHIAKIEWGSLEGRRPRLAGCNARLGAHGDHIRLPLVRLTTGDGSSGFGASRASPEHMVELLGTPLEVLWSPGAGTAEAWRAFDYPLWDLMGRRSGQPVYALVAAMAGHSVPGGLSAPCYDTSLYIDDLHLESTDEAAAYIAEEARAGAARGHRAFKLKVGRGARHMPLEEGTARDIAVVRAVRDAVGPQARLMLDANNGYNLNLAKRVLDATADCTIFWLEEAFHEDPVLYRELKAWLANRGLPVLIADGEGDASAHLLEWAEDGLVDVVQYDIYDLGFTDWLSTGQHLDALGVRSAPHHYSTGYGNYVACHLAAAIGHFTFVEWDEATVQGLDPTGYTIDAGQVSVPAAPGFGLTLEEAVFQDAIRHSGGVL